MISENNAYFDVAIGGGATAGFFAGANLDTDMDRQIAEINRGLGEAVDRSWGNAAAERESAFHLLRRFSETAASLEARRWPPELIRERLAPCRKVFATSCFMRRCQEWPRGYAGDFETVEYMAAGVNHSVPGSLGWQFENILLESSIVRQHVNKVACQAFEIGRTVIQNRMARVLSIACGGCLDWIPVLPRMKRFAGKIVSNDHEPAALELAAQRVGSATTHYRLAPGNIIRVAKRLAGGSRFDLVVGGGLFDYLCDRVAVALLRILSRDLLAPGGAVLFTNMAEGNPWRYLMEYGANWTLVERSEARVREICHQAGIACGSVSVKRDPTELALITIVR